MYLRVDCGCAALNYGKRNIWEPPPPKSHAFWIKVPELQTSTNSGHQDFHVVIPNICGSSVWDFLRVVILVCSILSCFLDLGSFAMFFFGIFVNCSWVDTRWQQYSTVHIYTQTVHRTTQKQYNTINNLFGKNVGRAPSLQVIPWNLLYY